VFSTTFELIGANLPFEEKNFFEEKQIGGKSFFHMETNFFLRILLKKKCLEKIILFCKSLFLDTN
jgi:hypothetical protein